MRTSTLRERHIRPAGRDRRHHQQCPQPLHGTEYPANDEHPGKPDGPVTGAKRHQCQTGNVEKQRPFELIGEMGADARLEGCPGVAAIRAAAEAPDGGCARDGWQNVQRCSQDDMGRHGHTWGDMGRHGETWGEAGGVSWLQRSCVSICLESSARSTGKIAAQRKFPPVAAIVSHIHSISPWHPVKMNL